jgi:hypothetical protein
MDLAMGADGWSVEEPWVRSAADVLGWAVMGWGVGITLVALLMLVLVTRVVRRRRFWCAPAHREVEVEFEERGLLGFRQRTAVLSCSAFDCPGEISCRRQCLRSEGLVRLPMDPPLRIRPS